MDLFVLNSPFYSLVDTPKTRKEKKNHNNIRALGIATFSDHS